MNLMAPPEDDAAPGARPSTSLPSPAAGNTNGTTTEQTLEHFRQVYNVELSLPVFVGLCAYLNTILIWRYHATPTKMDRFIVCYAAFNKELPQMFEHAASLDRCRMSSYHYWLDSPESREVCTDAFEAADGMGCGAILSEALLRQIWREQPFHFLWAMLSMQRVAADGLSNLS